MVPAPLEGRDEALDALRRRLERARAGEGGVVLVTGAAGVGKSALVARVAEEALAAGFEVARGRAWEYADAPPYFPVAPGLRALGVDPAHRPPGADFALWEETLAALAAASRARPWLWVVEDLHAADLQTLDLLTYLLSSLGGAAALVLATARPRDARTTARAAQRIERLGRDGASLALGPLDPEAARRLASRVRGRGLTDAEARQLHQRTGGVALFVAACARMDGAGALPPTVKHAAVACVEPLPERAREALAAGAVLGRDFSAGLVARVLDVLPAVAIERLEPAVRAGVLDEPRPGRFQFEHALVQEAVEDAIPAGERARLHARAADALASLDDSVDALMERTRHALASLPLGGEAAPALVARCVDALERAGAWDRCLAVLLRVREARAGGLWPAPWTPRDDLRAARAAAASGAFEASRSLCQSALDDALARRDGPALAEAALVFGATLRPAVVDPALVRWLESARSLCAGAPPALACVLDARLAAALQPARDPAVPVAMARDAIARARALGDESALIEALYHGGAALADYAPIEERIDCAEALHALAVARGDLPRQLRALARAALDHAELGRWADHDLAVDRMLERSAADGHPRHRWRPLLFASMRAAARGDLAASDEALAEIEQLRALTDDPGLELSLGAHRLLRACALHDTPSLRAALGGLDALATPAAQADVVTSVLRALVLCRLGEFERLPAALARVGDLDALARDRSFVAWLAEPVARAGTPEARRRALALLEAEPRPELVGGHVPVSYDGPSARARGLLRASLGDAADGERLLREALAAVSARGLLPWRARLLADLAALLDAAGRRGEAAPWAAEARSLAGELGMDGLLRELPTATAAAGATEEAPRGGDALRLERDGDGWRAALRGREARVRDSRGMQLLARLVARRGEALHVLALASDEGAALADGGAGPMLDAAAVRAYRARVEALDEALEEAERHRDLGRAERAREEREALQRELARALGLGGAARAAGSACERARVNVQRRLRDAVERLRAADAAIARHVEQNLRTGTWCRYGVAET
ncbi:MAG: AAA family ATPase [Polyangiales bacterium]